VDFGFGLGGPVALPTELKPFFGVEVTDEVSLLDFQDAPAHLTRARLEVRLANGDLARTRPRRRPAATYPPIPDAPRQLTFDDIPDP
jgi:hypothetical protein